MLAHANTTTDGSHFDIFMSLLDRYAGYLERAGKTSYRSSEAEARALFSRLPADRARWMLERLQNELAALDELVEAKEELNSTSRLMWRFLQRGRFSPTSDLFDKLEDGDVVEILGNNHVHIWQSLNYFDFTSASLERIYTEAWYEFMVRDVEVERRLAGVVNGLITGERSGTVDPQEDWHWIQEVSTARLFRSEILVRYISPFSLNGQVVGVIALVRCRNLVSTTDA